LRSSVAGDLRAPDEEYLKVAITRLLPQYYSNEARIDAMTGDILHRMADRFVARHRDTWLRDVLRRPRSGGAAEGFASLGRAVEADESGDISRGSVQAEAAVRLFQAAGNQPAKLRGDFECLYSSLLNNAFDTCAAATGKFLRSLRGRSYPWLTSQALIECGICQERSGDFGTSAAGYRDALAVAERSSYTVLALRALGASADRQRQIGNLAQSWREQARALALYWSGNYPPIRVQQYYSDEAFLADDASLFNTSAAISRENEEITAALGRTEFHAAALLRRGMSEIAAGLPGLAMIHLREAARTAATLSTEERRRAYQLSAELEMAALEAGRGEVQRPFERLIRIEPLAEHDDTLVKLRFQTELGRLRLRLGQYEEARALLQNAFRIGDTSRALASEAERPLWMRSMANIARALVECEIRSGADPQHAWLVWARYRGALFDPNTSSPIRQPVVPAGMVLLSFVELPSRLAVWLRTNRNLSFRELDVPVPRIREAAGRLVRACSNERSPEAVLRADARQLSQWLLGPWDSRLDGARSVVIETDEPVSSLPWPALVRANGHYWAEDFSIALRVAASRPLQPNLDFTSAQALAVGAPAIAADENLAPLPEARSEAEKISSLFPRSITLVGAEATLPHVLADLRSVQVFHFAGHGYGGEGGGLVLRGATDKTALLRAADIQHLGLTQCRLVVLSGCATGSGELHGPGDPQSLVRAFLCAGTRQVVASYWDLNSAGAGALMQEFYRALLNRAPVAESLRLATAALRTGRSYAHPYYWAGLETFQ